MTIKQHGGVFGRNPSFNDVSVETLSIAGTALSSTAAELNILDGVTADSTELNYLDGASTSVVTASKAVLANSSANIPLASGNGIDFSATANSVAIGATTTSELFADYEEGTWTPLDVSGAGVPLSSVTATYRKIGKSVTYFMEATVASNASPGGVLIGGLPYAPANDNFVGAFHNTGGNDYLALTNAAGVRIQIYDSGGSSVVVWNTLSTDTIRATGTYFTA